MMPKPTFYKIYYDCPDGDFLVYIGRTRNNLTSRFRNHFTGHVLQKTLDVRGVSRIEYAELETVADMYVAEIVLINLLKPTLNVDDKAKDELTIPVDIGFLKWKTWDKPELLKKWKEQLCHG